MGVDFNRDPVLAEEDRVVHDEALGVDRKVFAGQPVPPDLLKAYEAAAGTDKMTGPVEDRGKAQRRPARDKAQRAPETDK